MAIDAARSNDQPITRQDGGAGTDQEVNVLTHIGIACAPDAGDTPLFDADVALENPQYGIENNGVGEDKIKLAFSSQPRVCHQPIAHRFAESGQHLVTIGGVVAFDADVQVGVAQA